MLQRYRIGPEDQGIARRYHVFREFPSAGDMPQLEEGLPFIVQRAPVRPSDAPLK